MGTLLLRLKQIAVFLLITLSLYIYPYIIIGSFIWLKLSVFIANKKFPQIFVSPVTGLSSFFSPDKILKSPTSTMIHWLILTGTPDPSTVTSHLQSIYDLTTSKSGENDAVRKYAKLGYSLELWMGFLFWKRIDNFDIRNQITFIHNQSMDVPRFVEGIIRKPFRPGEPLWEIIVVTPCSEGASSEEMARTGCSIIFRTHHILLDGICLLKFWSALDSLGHSGQDVIQLDVNYKTSNTILQQNSWHKFLTFMKIAYATPYLSNRHLWTTREDNVLMSEQNYSHFDAHWWCNGLNRISLQRYRQPLRELGFSLTHAFLTGVGRGLEKFITENYGLSNLPKKLHITGSIPSPPYPDEELTNHWTIMRYKLNFTPRTLLEQLEDSRTEYKRALGHITPKAFQQMHNIVADKLPVKLYELIFDVRKLATLSLANIPGPVTSQTMFGIPITDIVGWNSLWRQTSGISIGIVTYNGCVTFAIIADSGCIKTRQLFDRLNQSIMIEMQFVLDQVFEMHQPTTHSDESMEIEKNISHDSLNSKTSIGHTTLDLSSQIQ